jgi:hypothetical protein
MTLTVRLDDQAEEALAEYAASNGISKSEAVKRGLRLLFESTPPQKSAYEIGKHLFGRHASGRTDGSVKVKQHYREAMRAKHIAGRRPAGRAV